MRAQIVPARPEHVAALAAKARPADVDELWAQGRTTPAEAMAYGLRRSRVAFTGLCDGEPMCMFGVTPYSILAGIGTAWLVGSTDMDNLRRQKALLLRSRAGLAELHRAFPLLINAVDERNAAAQRWLAWLGFTLLDPIPLGPDRLPFRPFYRIAEESPHV